MARIAIDSAIGAGFGLIRHRPGAVLLWGVLYAALVALTVALVGSYYFGFFHQIFAATQLGQEAGARFMSTLWPQMMAVQGWTSLIRIAGLFVAAMLYCAAFRAILHPDEGRLAYLRVGMAELMLFLLWFAAAIVFTIALVIYGLLVAAMVAALIALHATAAGVALAVLAALAAVVVLIWLALRFSMVGPMMVSDGKFHLFESWTLTRGHAGVLFIMAVCLFVIILVVEMVIMGVALIAGGASLASAAGGAANLASFLGRPPAQIATAIAPMLVVAVVVLIPLTGCFVAVLGAPWARAYLDLTAPEPEPIAS